jgi:integrase/recombinase XerD
MRGSTASVVKRQSRKRLVAPAQIAPESNWRLCLRRMEGAYSPNTIRSYRADFSIFEAWCEQQVRTALPATPETVAAFVLAQSEVAACATVSRRRAAIAKIHRLMKYENPGSTEEVNLATRTVLRRKGRRQGQALGLTNTLRRKLIRACPETLQGLRDRALIATGYDTLCRRAELVQLRIEDLTVKPDRSGTILIRRSKADQCGDGRLCYLSAETVVYLKRWLATAGLNSGPIFRAVFGTHAGAVALHPYSVVRIIKECAAGAKLGAKIIANLSGHSMRVGAAQDMAAAGIGLPAIMQAGGWSSVDMVIRYIEHIDIEKSGMAQMYARKQHQSADVSVSKFV